MWYNIYSQLKTEESSLRIKLFILSAVCAAMGVLLLVAGMTVPGCLLVGAALFVFLAALTSVREKPAPEPEQKPAPQYVCPLGWGLQKADLYYEPSAEQYIVRYAHEGRTKLISQDEAHALLVEKETYHSIVKLGEMAGFDPSLLLARSAARRDVRYNEVNRLPAEGELRQRQDIMGRLVEVYTNGVWVPDADKSEIAEGMHDHFTAFRIQQQDQSAQPTQQRNDRARYDKTLDRYYWTIPLEDSRTYFLTMVFDGEKKFLHHSFDVETARDGHYILDLDGEAQLRVLLTGGKFTCAQYNKSPQRLMIDFLKENSGSALEAMVRKVCAEQQHY